MNNNNEDIPEPLCEQKPSKFFGIEMHWMPAEGYAESNKESLRKIAMHQILQVSASGILASWFLVWLSRKQKGGKDFKMNVSFGRKFQNECLISSDC